MVQVKRLKSPTCRSMVPRLGDPLPKPDSAFNDGDDSPHGTTTCPQSLPLYSRPGLLPLSPPHKPFPPPAPGKLYFYSTKHAREWIIGYTTNALSTVESLSPFPPLFPFTPRTPATLHAPNRPTRSSRFFPPTLKLPTLS